MLLIVGLVLTALVVVEFLSRQVWLRFFYVLSVTIYRDDSPATYWFLMVLQSLIAAFFVVTGVLSLMK